MNPSYDPNVPDRPGDSFAVTQQPILDNFQTLYNAFAVNHIPINASGAGNHNIMQLMQLDNGPQTLTGEIAIYTKNVDGQTDQVFMRYQNNGTEVQLTNYQTYSLVQPPNQTAFFTFLPGKILVYFGSFTSLPNNILNLNPAVAKFIITADFCPIGTARDKPKMNLIQQGAIFTGISLTGTGVSTTLPPCYYIVMANI